MSYRVIKRIKGHLYLYEQSTFRVGGKVKTHSRYIGPVDGNGTVSSTSHAISKSVDPEKTTVDSVREELTLQINKNTKQNLIEKTSPPEKPQKITNQAKPPKTEPEKNAKTPPTVQKQTHDKPEPLAPTAKINLERFALSARALVSEFQNTTARLRRSGVNTTNFPPISLEYGSKVGYHKKAFSRTYVVTIPKREKGHGSKTTYFG